MSYKVIPKKEDQKNLPNRFNISQDELQHRMFLQSKYHDQPCAKAVDLMIEAMDNIMKKLGVDVAQEAEVIQQQQADLGITIWSEERDEMAGLQGYYIHTGGVEYIPHAWVGAPYLANDGLVYLDVHDFKHNVLIKFGGIKVPLEGLQ